MEVYLIFLLLSLAAMSFFCLYRSRRPFPHLPPGPTPLPVVGNLLCMGDKPHVSLSGLARTYGPVMSLRLGRLLTVVVTSPVLSQDVFTKNDKALSARSIPDALRTLGYSEMSIVCLPPLGRWRQIRRLFNTQMFTAQRLDANHGLRERKVREMVDYVEECRREGKAVDVGRVAFTATLNLISSTIFSADLVAHEGSLEFKGVVRDILVVAAASNISDFFPSLRAADLQGLRRRYGQLIRKLYAVFDEQADRRRSAMANGDPTEDDMLGVLLSWKDPEDNHNKLDRRTINAVLTDIFVAGSDTSSTTVEWAMAELLRNPTCMEAATEEVRLAVRDKPRVEEADITGLPYLHAVVKETLRLHPPVPFLLPREAQSAVELGGYTIPAGTRLLVNVWAIGRDESVWPEPEKFSPERFMEGEKGMKGVSFPFGGGRRICPGKPLAFRMVHLMLASLLHGFDWELPEGISPESMDMDDGFGLALAKATPLLAHPLPT